MPSLGFDGNDSGSAIATTILIVGAGAGTFASFCPSWFTVRSPFFHDQSAKAGNVNAIRQGEAAGTVVTMAEGIAASWLIGNWLPAIGAALISGLMILGYEYSIARPAAEHQDDKGPVLPSAFGWQV